jgi:hypothetical protein
MANFSPALYSAGVLEEATGGLVRIGEWAVGCQFQNQNLTFSNAW